MTSYLMRLYIAYALRSIPVDVRIKFGDSRSNRSGYIRAAHFVMDERTTPADGSDVIRRFVLKMAIKSTMIVMNSRTRKNIGVPAMIVSFIYHRAVCVS